METAGLEAHVVVLAVRVKGDVTWAPFAGVVTVMADVAVAADAVEMADKVGIVHAVSAKAAQERIFMMSALR